MGFFFKGSEADQELRAAQDALNDHCGRHTKAIRAGDKKAIAENNRLEEKVWEAEQGASRGERLRARGW